MRSQALTIVSDKKVAANRRNAKRSTGPRSPGGKAISRMNATQHGILTAHPLVAGEDADEFKQFCRDTHQDLCPQGGLEAELTDQIVHVMWRLRRLRQVEAGYYSAYLANERVEAAEAQMRRREVALADSAPPSFGDVSIVDPEAHARFQQQAATARFHRDCDENGYARAFNAAGDGFDKLARYERSLQRTLRDCLDQLARLQARS